MSEGKKDTIGTSFGDIRAKYAEVRDVIKESVKNSGADLKNPTQRHIARRAAFYSAVEMKQGIDKENGALRHEAETDPLTGANNLRGYYRQAREEIRRMSRTGIGFSYIIMDLDGLKWINDNEGYNKGDQRLMDTVHVLKNCIRDGLDAISRIGGDEFVVLLPGTDSEGAKAFWKRINEQFIDQEIAISGGATEATPAMLQNFKKREAKLESIQEETAFIKRLKLQAERAMKSVKLDRRGLPPDTTYNNFCSYNDVNITVETEIPYVETSSENS